jgi:hypothetical protein
VASRLFDHLAKHLILNLGFVHALNDGSDGMPPRSVRHGRTYSRPDNPLCWGPKNIRGGLTHHLYNLLDQIDMISNRVDLNRHSGKEEDRLPYFKGAFFYGRRGKDGQWPLQWLRVKAE